MPEIILGILVLVLLLWASSAFASVDPRKLAPMVKFAGGFGALGGAAFLAARGQLQLAVPLGFAGLGLLGWLPRNLAGFAGLAGWGGRTHKSPGQTSQVRSAFVEMELDHDTGAMRGRILAGRHEGVMLDDLDAATVVGFLGEIDEESRALLVAYLDRRAPRCRVTLSVFTPAGHGSPRWSGKMTEEEAYQVLGVQPGASATEIGRAHRTLMKKLHPDQGGSTYLAARVNEAKDVLLRRHR
jgi:DnaJ-domain-containing protein 1